MPVLAKNLISFDKFVHYPPPHMPTAMVVGRQEQKVMLAQLSLTIFECGNRHSSRGLHAELPPDYAKDDRCFVRTLTLPLA